MTRNVTRPFHRLSHPFAARFARCRIRNATPGVGCNWVVGNYASHSLGYAKIRGGEEGDKGLLRWVLRNLRFAMHVQTARGLFSSFFVDVIHSTVWHYHTHYTFELPLSRIAFLSSQLVKILRSYRWSTYYYCEKEIIATRLKFQDWSFRGFY